jgi:hypothetical protein
LNGKSHSVCIAAPPVNNRIDRERWREIQPTPRRAINVATSGGSGKSVEPQDGRAQVGTGDIDGESKLANRPSLCLRFHHRMGK